MKEKFDIIEVFPEISLISNPEIREKTIEVWNRLWDKSKFNKIMDLPVSPQKKYPHITHNRSVVQMVLKVADVIQEFHGVAVDRDILIASAILQDASKLVEMEPSSDGVAATEIGRLYGHAFYAAHIALEVGLPGEIAQAILCHTPDSATFPPTLISKILFYVDQIDMAAIEADHWKKTGFIYR